MPIKFPCPHCKKTLQVKEQLAGKKGVCPACKKPVTVPAPRAPAPTAAAKPAVDLEALAVETLIEPKRETPTVTATVDFLCPFCDTELHISAELAGRQTPCPECRRIVKVPLVEKTGPRDWRQADAKVPSGARRDQENLEGAWGSETSRGQVSREALVEADVIQEVREPLTARQWLFRGAAAALALLVVGGGAFWLVSYLRLSSERDLLAQAEKQLEPEELKKLPPEMQKVAEAELHRLLGEYYHRLGKPDAKERTGLQRLQLARLAAGQIEDDGERHAILRELLGLQIEFALGVAKEQEKLEPAKERRKQELAEEQGKLELEIGQTLALARPGAFRYHVVREVCRAMLADAPAEQIEDRKTKLERIIRQGVPDQEAPARRGTAPQQNPSQVEPDHSEQIACLGILGQELARLGHTGPAKALAERQRELYQPQYGYPKPLAVLLVWLQVGELRPREGEDQQLLSVARLEGLARAGDLDLARQILDGELRDARTKLDALLAYAEVLIDKKQVEKAGPVLESAVGLIKTLDGVDWQRQRLLELFLAAGNPDRAKQLATDLLSGAALGRGQLGLLKAELQAKPDEQADMARAQSITQGISQGLAAACVARHNARLSASDAKKQVEALESEWVRGFGAAGIALGSKDKN